MPYFLFAWKCQFALLAHRPGLIDPFPDLNDISGLFGIPCSDAKSTILNVYTVILHRSVYFTADHIRQPFTRDTLLRLYLMLMVSIFPTSLPYAGCLTMPVSRHLLHIIRTAHARSLHALHMVLIKFLPEIVYHFWKNGIIV